jgi:hypothetical protein
MYEAFIPLRLVNPSSTKALHKKDCQFPLKGAQV